MQVIPGSDRYSTQVLSILALLFAGSVCAQFDGTDQPLCGTCPFPLVVDMDNDGDPDLLYAAPELGSINLQRNEGNEQFDVGIPIAVNLSGLRVDLAMDADADGDIDLIGAAVDGGPTGVVVILRNGGDLTFTQETIDQPMGTTGRLDRMADLNGDGLLDLLSLQAGDRDYWYRSTGTGTFQREEIPHWCAAVGGPYVALDAENDGDIDLIRYDATVGRVLTVWNVGGGRFGPWTYATPTLIASSTADADPLDVDGDGLVDLVIGGRVLYSIGNGTFIPSDNIQPHDHQSLANVDCDPAPEAVLSRSVGTSLLCQRLDEIGQYHPLSPQPPMPSRNGLHDLDMDGRMDLLLGPAQGQDAVYWRTNTAVPVVVTLDIPGTDTIGIDAVLDLGGGYPVDGGYYTGTGVFNNTLYATIAGTGPVVITYHYLSFTTQDLCGGTATDTLFIVDYTGIRDHGSAQRPVYPDPADAIIHMDLNGDVVIDVAILDGSGRRHPALFQRSRDRIEIRTNHLADGLHVLELIDNAGKVIRSHFMVLHGHSP